MPITELRTYEGVPIGDDNFDNYLFYIRDLVSRSNPFIETSTNDENQIVYLGDNVTPRDGLSFQTETISNGQSFAYFVPSSTDGFETSSGSIPNGSSSINIKPSTLTGDILFRLEFSFDAGDTNINFDIEKDSSTIYGPFLSTDSTSAVHYFSANISGGTTLSLSVNSSVSDGIPYSITAYNYQSWTLNESYLINYSVTNPVFDVGNSAQLKIYFGDPNVVEATDDLSNLDLVDSVPIKPGNSFNESLVFKPSSTIAGNSLIFSLEDSGDYSASFTIDVDSYILATDSLLYLSGNSYNSYAFISNDDNELYALSSYFLSSDHSTPGLDRWRLPLASVTEFSSSPGNYSYVFEGSALPEVFNRFYSTDYQSAKFNRLSGGYKKGMSLVTLNGIPQVEDDQLSYSSFYNEQSLISSDVFEFTSLRLGSEYPLPIYTDVLNHQYASEVIEGFSGVDRVNTTDSSLGNIDFSNRVSFPYTDFLLNPTILLIHYDSSASTTSYYYVPKDANFSSTVTKNHYRVIDPSSGTLEFNFELGLDSPGDKFWIVSAEQLSQSTADTVTEYFSSYGKLYYPTANSSLTTKILSFDSSILIDTDLETTLPELTIIPQTKIIGSGGGAILADSEGEFEGLTIYALSYPGRVDYDEFVRLQANRYEPDIVNFFYYCGSTPSEFSSSTKPYPVYIKLENNDVSWYNRGINDLTYDPVSRSVNTDLCLTAENLSRPENSAKLSELKRKTALSSSLAGTVTEVDTSFMEAVGTGFLVGSSSNTVKTLSGASGSLLYGTGGEPSVLSIGSNGEVLTVSGGTLVWSAPGTVDLSGYALKSGDTFTGAVVVEDTLTIGVNGGGDSILNFYDDNSDTSRSFFWDDSENDWRIEGNDGNNYKLWHAGNDGSGSSLDADLLDGQEGSYYLNTSSTTQTKTGILTLYNDNSSGVLADDKGVLFTAASTSNFAKIRLQKLSPSGDEYLAIDTTASDGILISGNTTFNDDVTISGTLIIPVV